MVRQRYYVASLAKAEDYRERWPNARESIEQWLHDMARAGHATRASRRLAGLPPEIDAET